MANRVTIKVVSQIVNLRYQGVGSTTSCVAASRMNALLGVKPEGKVSGQTSPGSKSSLSYTLAEGSVNVEDVKIGKVFYSFEQALLLFESMSSATAVNRRKQFFTNVEAGKKVLVQKYGERIPKEEILKLSKEMSQFACIIWKHQIVTTRTSETPFEGSRLSRDGSYTCTIKSKTIYTESPLTEDQLKELESALNSSTSDATIGLRRRAIPTAKGYVHAWVTHNGTIMFREEGSSSTARAPILDQS